MDRWIELLLISLMIISCKDHFTPKPKGYFRIDFPEKKYREYNGKCPFVFDYPLYASIDNDSLRTDQTHWFNINYQPFNARLYVSYEPVKGKQNLYALEEDARTLVYKHTVKADAINEDLIKTKNNVFGILYNIEGNSASVIQFYLTDKTTHYIRCALYFNVKTNRDSLDPVINFIRSDIKRMIGTLKWKNNP